MKIIDLLNKIANGEEVPKKVRYDDEIYDTEISNNFSLMIYEATGKMCDDGEVQLFLNDEVEILEEEKTPTKEEIKEYTNKFLEAWIPVKKQFGKLFDELIKITNDLEEEKKIPEKLEIYEDEEGHYFIDKHCKKIYITCDEVNFMVEEFNQLIDYLKSKGE